MTRKLAHNSFFSIILRSAFLLTVFCTEASAQTDSLLLDSTVVSVRRNSSVLAAAAGKPAHVDMARLAGIPSILGNSDPLHFAQLLPSMQSSSELDAGIHIQGCDNQHNIVSLDGVPVYDASHLLGLFSVFNPSHFKSMTYSTVAAGVNRLGGSIDMQTDRNVADSFGGEASAGLISAQGTLRIPLSQKASVSVSGRRSFLDLLYGDSIKLDDAPLNYGFSDLNANAVWTPSDKDLIRAGFYYGADSMDAAMESYGIRTLSDWSNLAASLHWKHSGLEQSLYHSERTLDVLVDWKMRKVDTPSYIRTTGYKASWEPGRLRFDADLALHEALPQSPSISGSDVNYSSETVQRASENRLSAAWKGSAGLRLDYTLLLAGTWYHTPETGSRFSLSPEASLSLNLFRSGRLDLRGGVRHQYLFQTGLSNLGFPVEFWIPAGRYGSPQRSLWASLSYNLDIHGGDARFCAELYSRQLTGQVEYTGTLLDFLNGTYSLEDALILGDGHNFGLNLMLHKMTGRLTGWAAFSLGRSLRTFNGETWPSSHERLAEFKLVASYRAGRWDLGGTFLAAGGTPFTEADEFYLLNGQIIPVFGGHNAKRLDPYIRLDLDARYTFRSRGRFVHGLDFCVYNATAHRQEIFRTLKFNHGGAFGYVPMYLGVTILPSVSYFVRF